MVIMCVMNYLAWLNIIHMVRRVDQHALFVIAFVVGGVGCLLLAGHVVGVLSYFCETKQKVPFITRKDVLFWPLISCKHKAES